MSRAARLAAIARAARQYPAVAFDVFDTLLYRDLARPADLFVLMERQGKAPAGFAAARAAAEADARANARAARRAEVTLAQIYAAPALAACGADPAAEIAAETAVLRADPAMVELVNHLRAAGKRVYIVSDMYLPEKTIAALLRGAGYPAWDGIFVSSEAGVQKRSGRLFRLFLQTTGLRAGKVLFVGNDRRADALGAALAGIRCMLVPPRAAPAHWPRPQSPEAGALAAFVANRALGQNAAENIPEALGYALLGPLLLAFAQWLHARRAGHPGAALVFLARDMALVRELYEAATGETAGYLQVSRRSLIPVLLLRPLSERELALLADALPRQRLTAAALAEYAGFAPGALPPGVEPGTVYDFRSRPLPAVSADFLRKLAAFAKGPAGAGLRDQAALTRRYLREQGIGAGTLLVDIGSGGTTQRILEALTGAPLHGYYLACDARLHAALPAGRAEAFLFGGAPAPLWYWAGQPMLERLISEPAGPTHSYALEGPAGAVRPVHGPALPDAAGAVTAVQAGVRAFARDWRAGPWAGEAAALPADAMAAAWLDFVRAPRAGEADALGDLVVEDGGVWPLAAPQRPGFYAAHPRALARDLAAARWKTGFLTRLFRLPLPYGAVYERAKRADANKK